MCGHLCVSGALHAVNSQKNLNSPVYFSPALNSLLTNSPVFLPWYKFASQFIDKYLNPHPGIRVIALHRRYSGDFRYIHIYIVFTERRKQKSHSA